MTTEKEANPLKMVKKEGLDFFVLPAQVCTKPRVDFFDRANLIQGFYLITAMYCSIGQQNLIALEQKGELKDDTPVRGVNLGEMDLGIQLNHGLEKKLFQLAGGQLTNQVFLMTYGNFEAYLYDCIFNASQSGSETEKQEQAIQLLMHTGWRGKFDRISQRFSVNLGWNVFKEPFRKLDMGFFGEKCEHPVEFLDKMADLRHRLVHSTGRVDAQLIAKYPKSGLKLEQPLVLPLGLPTRIHLFFVLLTEVVDRQFAGKFKWTTSTIEPEKRLESILKQ